MPKTKRTLRDKETVRKELAEAERLYRALNKELLEIEDEEVSEEGDKIFLVPVSYSVRAYICVSAPNLETADERAADMSTPVGDYMDDSWIFNTHEDSEEALLQGYVR